MKKFLDAMQSNLLIFDGSKGYMLQQEGLSGGESAEVWNITHKDTLRNLYQKYKDAGSDVIQTNTFQATGYHLGKYGYEDRLYDINYTAAKTAKEVMGDEGYVAASVGPLGRMMEPAGDLSFDEAYDLYKGQIKPLIDGGVNAVNFETFTDVAELRAAVLAVKDNWSDIPVIASVAFEQNKRTLMGTPAYIAGLILKTLGCEVIGTNCSFGPSHMLDIVKDMSKVGGPVCVKPNAGMPRIEQGHVIYDQTAEGFADACIDFTKYGAVLIGGCCGTTPEFISALKSKLSFVKATQKDYKETNEVSSLTDTIVVDDYKSISKRVVDISCKEYIDIFKYVNQPELMSLAFDIQDEACDIVEITAIDCEFPIQLEKSLDCMQGFIKKPFVFKTNQSELLNKLLRIYRGRAGVVICDNSVTNIVKKYGALPIII